MIWQFATYSAIQNHQKAIRQDVGHPITVVATLLIGARVGRDIFLFSGPVAGWEMFLCGFVTLALPHWYSPVTIGGAIVYQLGMPFGIEVDARERF